MSLREANFPVVPEAVHTVADSNGAIQLSLQAYVPPVCTSIPGTPELQAIGDKGTTVTSYLHWAGLPADCASGYHNSGGGSPPPPVSTYASVGLYPKAVHPGKIARAVVQTNGTIRLAEIAVRYPGHGPIYREVDVGQYDNAMLRTISWRVPRHLRRGTAQVRVTFEPGNRAVTTSLPVR